MAANRSTRSVSKLGKIKSVYCKNFVTYSESIHYPTEYLNVIIGPNGSGKSTLVSAIVLGLGGDPKILARSSSIADYVKNGCDSATIIIEIYGGDDNTTKFQRSIDLQGKSNFAFNDTEVTQKKYLAHVDAFKIQIGNLCQFLPQDKVQDFAKMNPQQILNNTINSICGANVIENFKNLKDLRSRQEEGKSSYKSLVQKLEESMNRVEELKSQLDLYNARKDVEEKLNVCNAKKLHLEIKDIETKIKELENEIEMAKHDLVVHEREYNVVTRKQAQIQNINSSLKKEIEDKDRGLKTAIDNKCLESKKIEELKNKILEAKSKFEKKKLDVHERKNELQHEIKLLEAYAQDVKNLNTGKLSESEMERRLNECHSKMEKIKQEAKQLNNEHRRYQNKIDENVSEIQSLESRLKSLEDSHERKLEFLKVKYPDVYQAVKWLNENSETFEGRVYKPIILEINVKNPAYSKYLENTINIRDLLAFSCENENDISRFVTELCNKRNLLVNVLHAPTPDVNVFVPTRPIENLRTYGFESYLINLVNGPTAILGFLCSVYQLQNIPFGDDNVNIFTDKIPHDVTTYFGGDLRYSVSISKYGKRQPTLMQNYISSKGLLSSRDESEITAIKQRLSELSRILDSLRNERSSFEVNIQEKKHRYNEESQIKIEIQSKKREIQQKAALVERQKQKIVTLKEELTAFPEFERVSKEFGANAVKDLLKLQKLKVKALSVCQKAITQQMFSKTKLTIFNQKNEELVNLISSMREKRDSAKIRVEKFSSKINNLKREIKLKLSESLSLTNNFQPSDPKFTNRTFYSGLPNTLEELREVINDFSGRLDCMDGVNSEIVREYDARRIDVESLKQDIESNLHGNENLTVEIGKVFDLWYPMVSDVIANINNHFGKFMQNMGYVGEVKLVRKEEYDFDTYGIEILVQYRKNVPLQPLDRHVQSGGERAVAIAVYTLSMQHLTHVPFRCVDEINQGMDARNERKVFEMLVDETTKVGSAQYFFVTPKLLPHLKTNDKMSVHVVLNGRMIQGLDVFT